MDAKRPLTVNCTNEHLPDLNEDVLYHLGFSTKTVNMKQQFGDVRIVCIGGSENRIKSFAQQLAAQTGEKAEIENLAAKGGRFVLFKVGAVLLASHGMGTPSTAILLHELFKLLHYAECKDVTVIRVGSCGGLGVMPGTLVVTSQPVNTNFEPFYELHILGKPVYRVAEVDEALTEELYELAKSMPENIPVVKGKTVTCNDFYEEQARLDGAFCGYTEEEKLSYLRKAYAAGVRNFEMEATCVAALCRMANARAAIVCVALVDRLHSDQVTCSPDDYSRLQLLPCKLITAFLKKHGAIC